MAGRKGRALAGTQVEGLRYAGSVQ